PVAEHVQVVRASGSGWLRDLDALCVGIAAWRLGAGRARKEDPVSPGAAVICLAKPGEAVTGGQPLLELRTDDPARFGRALDALDGAIEIGAEPPVIGPTVLERIA
ncbi:MAG TPA: thymidine phosphorylase, partial [Streptosporangiaceae bacterium]|nr:thymidine phosphorylase [Streptosporangiaceae bacterium]